MYQCTYRFGDNTGLKNVINLFKSQHPENKACLFIQIYSHSCSPREIVDEIDMLTAAFPEAEIVGFTSSVIYDGMGKLQNESLICFCAFEKTKVDILYYDTGTVDEKEAGKQCLDTCLGIPDLRAIEILSIPATTVIEPFFNILEGLDPEVAVFGGGANISADSSGTPIIFTKNGIKARGILVVLFSGALSVLAQYHFGWHPLGIPMKITKTDGDRIITELDGKPAIHIYEHYLKYDPHRDSFSKFSLLPFPLMLKQKDFYLPMLPQFYREDGALGFIVICPEGGQVRIGYGDPVDIMNQSLSAASRLSDFKPEAHFGVTCLARGEFLGDKINRIVRSYSEDSPSAGAFMEGEFFRIEGKIYHLNLSGLSIGMKEKMTGKIKTEKVGTNPVSGVLPSGDADSDSYMNLLASLVTETSKELEAAQEQMQYLATHDRLTRLLDRRTIENDLQEAIRASSENKESTTVGIMLDLDYFKSVNDNYGHDVGDIVLHRSSEIIMHQLRSRDCAGRWGGEEFIILLQDVTAENAVKIADRLCKSISEEPILPDGKHITASFGVTPIHPGENQTSFFRRLDFALYSAKKNGRNQVCFEP